VSSLSESASRFRDRSYEELCFYVKWLSHEMFKLCSKWHAIVPEMIDESFIHLALNIRRYRTAIYWNILHVKSSVQEMYEAGITVS
jgi:hypothetical protein